MKVELITPQDLQQLHQKVDNLQATMNTILTEGIPPAREPENRLLTREEAARKLRITVNTLAKYTKEGLIKSNKIGRRVLYKVIEIEKSLETIENEKYRRQK